MPKMASFVLIIAANKPAIAFFELHKYLSLHYLLQMGRNSTFSALKLVYRLHVLYELYRKMQVQKR